MRIPKEIRGNMQIVNNSVIYLGSSILNKMIPFLLLPILTKYLSPKEYGILSIYIIMITVYTAFISMAMHTNISRNFFKISKQELSLYIGNMFIILSFTFIIYLIITYLITLQFTTIFSIPSNWLLLIPFISSMIMINEMNTTILRNEQRAYMFGLFEISNTIVKLGVTILLLLAFSYGWYSQVFGILTGSLVFFIVGLVYMYKRDYINLKYNKEKVKDILSISVPLIPHLLGAIVIAMSDRLFIENMVSIEAVGIYSVGYMFGMVVMLFTDAFIKAWSPWFYQNLSTPTQSKKKKIVKYTYVYIVAIFILAIAISLIGELILPYFVDERFYGASEFILWVSLGYAVQGVYKIFFPYLVHISKTSFLAFSTIVAAILNLAFNYVLIKYYGTIGAAYATILAFAVSAILVFWYQSKHYPMPWNLKRIDVDE